MALTLPKFSTAFAVLTFLPAAIAAQNLTITAEVDKNVVALNDQIILNVTVSGPQTDVPDPELPSMPNFSVYSQGRSQNISIVNGQVSGSVTNTYVLQPRFVGKVTIGPIAVTVGGHRAESRPIDVQVVRPSQAGQLPPAQGGQQAQSSPRIHRPSKPGQAPNEALPDQQQASGAPDVFISAELDKKKAFVNEQVNLRVRFYTSVPLLGNPQYNTPQTEGFLTEDLPPERHGQSQYKGRLYHYSEIKTALFPAKSGKLTIGTAVVHCQVQTEVPMDPFAGDFFQKFFAQGLLQGQTRELKTEPLTLTVMPLPEDHKPDSFSGAVGQFKISADVDKTDVRVGEAATLNVTIDGAGNLKSLGAPKMPPLADFRVFDTLSASNLRKANDIVQGSKSFKTVLVPRASGKLTIPAIDFVYFDPAKQQYVGAKTSPIAITAQASTGGKPSVSYVGTSGPADITPLAEDIRFVKDAQSLSPVSRGLAAVARQSYIHLLPLLLFLCAGGANYVKERAGLDPAGARFKSAAATARKRITEAERFLDSDPGKTTGGLFEALSGFLADKLNCAAYGLTLREASEMIQSRFPNIDGRLIGDLKSVWEDLDLYRFAGAKMGSKEAAAALAAKAGALIKDMDREMKR